MDERWFDYRARRDERRAREADEARKARERFADLDRLLTSEDGVEHLARMVCGGSPDLTMITTARAVVFEIIRLRARVEELERRSDSDG
jgi:hypothetical protein